MFDGGDYGAGCTTKLLVPGVSLGRRGPRVIYAVSIRGCPGTGRVRRQIQHQLPGDRPRRQVVLFASNHAVGLV